MYIIEKLGIFKTQQKFRCNKITQLSFIASVLIAAISINGCSDGAEDSSESGELVLGLTDAAGDFSHYTVDVTQITLTKLNGAVVNVLPLSTQVDFAQYTEMTEFLTAATVPAGIYKNATLSLDYSNADIWVEDNSGVSVRVDNIIDGDGNVVSNMDVSVKLDGRKRLVIVAGTPAHMTLDFDLSASNVVEFNDADVPTVTVEPILIADLEFSRPKIHRVRGPLARVNVEQQLLGVVIRPFHHSQDNDSRFGSLLVKVNDKTVYDINNDDYLGNAGLEAMAALPNYAATIVIGNLKFNPVRFLAREVYAGSSVPGGSLDVVKGTVIARTGDTLTVRGATLIRAGGNVIFGDQVSVEISSITTVKRQLSIDPASSSDISVGQRVSIFGSLNGGVSSGLLMDATSGLVRMKMTNLRGTSIAQISTPDAESPFIVNLQAINHLRVGEFDFAGTGIDSNNDADASNYEIATASLDLNAIADNTPVLVKGFVSPFGQAPRDFDGISVTDFSEVPASMAVSWNQGTDMPFSSYSEIEAVLIEGSGKFHHFGQVGIKIDIKNLANAASLVVPTTGEVHFVIVEDGVHQVFSNISAWIDSMNTRISNGSSVRAIRASGHLDVTSAELLVKDAVMILKPAEMTIQPVDSGTNTTNN